MDTIDATITYEKGQNIVVITKGGEIVLEVPLDDFLKLPAIRYVRDLAIEGTAHH
jgi:uncharacterized protein YjiK